MRLVVFYESCHSLDLEYPVPAVYPFKMAPILEAAYQNIISILTYSLIVSNNYSKTSCSLRDYLCEKTCFANHVACYTLVLKLYKCRSKDLIFLVGISSVVASL